MIDKRNRFETEVLPHLDAAYSLARWLVRDEHVAEDIVQDAFLRAFQYFGRFHGDAAKPWLLGIVRNVCYTWFAQNKRALELVSPQEDAELEAPSLDHHGDRQTPETVLAQTVQRAMVNAAIVALPIPFREVLVLRELEELSYEDIARISHIPLGTVMSRLSRARALLRKTLSSLQSTS